MSTNETKSPSRQDPFDSFGLVQEIRILRDLTVGFVVRCIAEGELHRHRNSHELLPVLQGNELKLSAVFDKLRDRWKIQLDWRVPQNETNSYKQIARLFSEIEDIVKGRRAFSTEEYAPREIVDLYVQPFINLERWTKRLSRKTDLVSAFVRENGNLLQRVREKLDGRTGVFVSINHGNEESQDPLDVRTIASCLSQIELKESVRFVWARDPSFDIHKDIATNAKLLLHACPAVAVFFTGSNLKERGVPHNPNVCLEFGFAEAIGKAVGVFMDAVAGDEFGKQIKDFAMMRNLKVYKYTDPFHVGDSVLDFLSSRLGLPSTISQTASRKKTPRKVRRR